MRSPVSRWPEDTANFSTLEAASTGDFVAANDGYLQLGAEHTSEPNANGYVGGEFGDLTVSAATPEPSTWAMLGLGLVAGAVMLRRRQQI